VSYIADDLNKCHIDHASNNIYVISFQTLLVERVTLSVYISIINILIKREVANDIKKRV